jgi:GTP cyclohydrolase I
VAPIDTGRIEAAVAGILTALGGDPGRAGVAATPRRVAATYSELFRGLDIDGTALLRDAAVLAPATGGETVLQRNIPFRSVCEHHLLPFVGVAHVAVAPGAMTVGPDTVSAVVEAIAARPQVQERLAEEIADALHDGLSPRGVLVVLDASHGCVTTRGVRQVRSSIVTLASRGTLSAPAERARTIALMGTAE